MAHSILPYGATTYVPLARDSGSGPVVSRWCEQDRPALEPVQQLIHMQIWLPMYRQVFLSFVVEKPVYSSYRLFDVIMGNIWYEFKVISMKTSRDHHAATQKASNLHDRKCLFGG